MKTFQPVLAALLILIGLATPAVADDWQDCRQGDTDTALAACSKIIGKGSESDKQLAVAYNYRGTASRTKGELDQAIRDYAKAVEIDPTYGLAYIELGIAYISKGEHDKAIKNYTSGLDINPKNPNLYTGRATAYREKGEYDKAIADCTKAIEIDPKYELTYYNRGRAYAGKNDLDRAIADYTKSIEINPRNAYPYNDRGIAYSRKGDHDRAIADYTKSIEINPKSAVVHTNRGNTYNNKGEQEKAIEDYTKAISISPMYAIAYNSRGRVFETKGNLDAAIADYEKVIALPPTSATDSQRQEIARQRIVRLKETGPSPSISKPTRRVALVIGNSNYSFAGILPNPVNDARAIAATLGRLGFAVWEHYDLTRDNMGRALKEFGDRAEGAEWAVVFFAGHGLEINGTAYLIPTDAELKRDSHVSDEALSLTQVQAKVDAASKLGLVILDACRNNPFVSRMVRAGGTSRSIGRGLSPIEPEGNVLVAYAAKHGTTAEDGSGKHSPFTEALLGLLEEPGLEINFFFRKVRDQVREKTAKQQEPFVYGSLGSEPLYFKAATAR